MRTLPSCFTGFPIFAFQCCGAEHESFVEGCRFPQQPAKVAALLKLQRCYALSFYNPTRLQTCPPAALAA